MAINNDRLLSSGSTERTQGNDEMAIQANSFGGLNLSANPLNIPYEDSPLMRNVVTDLSGAIVKRKGTQVLTRRKDDRPFYKAMAMMPVTTSFGYNLLCMKAGLDLEVYEVINNRAERILTKGNVWTSAVDGVRPGWVVTSEIRPRLLVMTGFNKPVQFSFNEIQTIAAVDNEQVFTNATEFEFSNQFNTIVWVNRSRYTGATPTFSYNGTTKELTVGLDYVLQAGDVVDLTQITWQWWAEAFYWQGDRFYGTQTRFNSVLTDQVVKVPDNLMTYLSSKETKARVWDMLITNKSNNAGDAARQVYQNGNPSLSSEWTYSDGSRYIAESGNKANPTPFFITFGRIIASGDNSTPLNLDDDPPLEKPTTAYFSRRRQTPFEYGRGVTAPSVDVYVDGDKKVRYTSVLGSRPTYLSYGLAFVNGALITNDTDLIEAVEFWADDVGVPQTSIVEIVNNKKTHIGTAATQNLSTNVRADGAYVPAYGLGLFADYGNGEYPSNASIYQDRLVLSGFSHRPTLVLFSNTSDSVTPGILYNYYQITDDPFALQATSPFDVELPKRGSDDRVVATIEWQRSVFVLSRRATYRVSPGASGVLGVNSAFVTFLSSTGCVNNKCVVQTESAIFYLSDSGLYDLNPRVEDGEYKVNEQSIKIRKKFGLTSNPDYENVAWINYDPLDKYIYVGYPAVPNKETSTYLFVYDTSRNSWTEFDTQGWFRIWDARPITDRALGNIFAATCTTEQQEDQFNNDFAGLNMILLKFGAEKYVDYYDVRTRSNVNEIYPTLQLPDIVFDISSPVEQTFRYNYEEIRQKRGFPVHPITDIRDCTLRITRNGVGTFDSQDWLKKPGDAFFLTNRAKVGDRLTFQWTPPNNLKNPQGYSHMVVWVDNVRFTNWEMQGSGAANDKYFRMGSDATDGAKVEWGFIYSAYYESPMFFNNQLGNYKRMKHLYAFFDNEQGLATYREYENKEYQDPEALTDLYRQYVNANISVLYSAERSGATQADTYGFQDVYFDDALWDFDPSAEQSYRYSLFKEPLAGVGYAYQLAVWSTDEAMFKLAGYQFHVAQKGRRYGARS